MSRLLVIDSECLYSSWVEKLSVCYFKHITARINLNPTFIFNYVFLNLRSDRVYQVHLAMSLGVLSNTNVMPVPAVSAEKMFADATVKRNLILLHKH